MPRTFMRCLTTNPAPLALWRQRTTNTMRAYYSCEPSPNTTPFVPHHVSATWYVASGSRSRRATRSDSSRLSTGGRELELVLQLDIDFTTLERPPDDDTAGSRGHGDKR